MSVDVDLLLASSLRLLLDPLLSSVESLLQLSGGQSVYSCASSLFGGAVDKLLRALVRILRHRVIHRRGRRTTASSSVENWSDDFSLVDNDEDCLPFVVEALRGAGLRQDLIPSSEEALVTFLKCRLMESSLSETLALLLMDEDLIRRHYDPEALANNREMVGFVVGTLHALDLPDQERMEMFSLIRRVTDSRSVTSRRISSPLNPEGGKQSNNERSVLNDSITQLVSKILDNSRLHPLGVRLQLQADHGSVQLGHPSDVVDVLREASSSMTTNDDHVRRSSPASKKPFGSPQNNAINAEGESCEETGSASPASFGARPKVAAGAPRQQQQHPGPSSPPTSEECFTDKTEEKAGTPKLPLNSPASSDQGSLGSALQSGISTSDPTMHVSAFSPGAPCTSQGVATGLDETRSWPANLNLSGEDAAAQVAAVSRSSRPTHHRSVSDTPQFEIQPRSAAGQHRRQMSYQQFLQTDAHSKRQHFYQTPASTPAFDSPPSPPSGGWRAPRPLSRDQTLASYIASGHFSQHQARLDKENAHLILSEAVMQSLNKVYNERNYPIMRVLSQNFRLQEGPVHGPDEKEIECLASKLRRLPSDGGSVASEPSEPAALAPASSQDGGSDVCARPIPLSAAPSGFARKDNSAEAIALALLASHEADNLPKPKVSDVPWLAPMEDDDQQEAFPFLRSYSEATSSYSAEDTNLRGNFQWAPPRPQLIFELHEQKKIQEGVSSQNFQCRGCGMHVDAKYLKKFRYCAYFGAYFCTSCHSNKENILPAKIVHKWNFKEEPVSDYAVSVISSHLRIRRIDIQSISPDLVQRVAKLRKAIEYKEVAALAFPFILACKAEETTGLRSRIVEYDIENPTEFTLFELCQIKLGAFTKDLKSTLDASITHVMSCKHCHMHGHICESCRSEDILFPFQTALVSQCPGCKACYHVPCFENLSKFSKECSKCKRIRERLKKKKEVEEEDRFE